jgi:hypothetical protein
MEWNQLIRRGVMVEKWIESRGQDLTGTITSTEREREIEEQRERTEGEKEVGSLGRGERREKSGMGG